MESRDSSVVRFGVFEVDLEARELRKRGVRIKLQEQPFRLLEALLEKPGAIVSREEIQQQLWPDDTFVDFDKSLNTAVQKVRLALGDSAESPRFVETIPRRGYRFVAPVEAPVREDPARLRSRAALRNRTWLFGVLAIGAAGAAALGFWLADQPTDLRPEDFRLRQLTHDDGLSFQPTLSPDGKLVAYASDRDGQKNLDIYVQQISGGEPRQITFDPADDHQPHFSPTGDQIAFRSERSGGGVYLINALGTDTLQLVASGGRDPRVSPDGKSLAFRRGFKGIFQQLYVVGLSGERKEVRLASDFQGAQRPLWTPDGDRVMFLGWESFPDVDWYTSDLEGGPPERTGLFESVRELGLRAATPYNGNFVRPKGWFLGTREAIFTGRISNDVRLWGVRFDEDWRVDGAPRPLTLGGGTPEDPAAALNGSIAFAQIQVRLDIMGLPTGSSSRSLLPLARDIDRWSLVSLSRAGDKLVYSATRADQNQVWVKDVAIDKATSVAAAPSRALGNISPDGSQVALRIGTALTGPLGDSSEIRVAPSSGGPSRKLCDDCGTPWSWLPDGTRFLSAFGGLRVVEVDSGKVRTLRKAGQVRILDPVVSPNGRFIASHRMLDSQGAYDSSKRRLYVAKFDGEALSPEDEWIAVTDGKGIEGFSAWSAEGDALYYWGVEETSMTLYKQPLNPGTAAPTGPRETVVAFTEFGQRLYGGGMSPRLAVSEKLIAFKTSQMTGNVWIMEPKDSK